MSGLSAGIKHRSGFSKNMHALEISLAEGFTRDAMEKAAAFVQVAQMSGLVAILKTTPEIAKDLEADGVILDQAEDIKSAQDIMGEDAIIGLACGTNIDAVRQAVQSGADYVTLGDGADIPAPELLLLAKAEQQDLVIAMLGPLTPKSAPFFVNCGATFIDGTHYITASDNTPIQSTVNLLHAVKEALPSQP